MKKTFTLLFIFSALITSAQTTLTSIAVPPPGSNVTAYAKEGVITSSSGNNQIWDFSNVTGFTDTIQNYCYAATSTPFATTFPSANLATTSDNSTYMYAKYSSSEETIYGMHNGDANLDIIYTDPQTVLKVPLAFNQTFEDQFTGHYVAYGYNTSISGSLSVKYDGFGILKTTLGTFDNVTKLLMTKVETYTIDQITFSTVYVYTTVTTSYINQSNYFPYFATTELTASSAGMKSTTNTILLYKNPEPVTEIKKRKLDLVISPNPASENVLLKNMEQGKYHVIILDRTGNIIQKKNIYVKNSTPVSLNVTNLSAGVYFVKVISDNSAGTAKLIKF